MKNVSDNCRSDPSADGEESRTVHGVRKACPVNLAFGILTFNDVAEIDLAIASVARMRAQKQKRMVDPITSAIITVSHKAMARFTTSLANEFQRTSSRCVDVRQATSSTFKDVKVG